MYLPILSLAYLLSGFCVLVYETVWIYRLGRVFGSTALAMGCVVAVFFAGLALGSWWFGRKFSRGSNPLRVYAFLEAAIGGYALACPWLWAAADVLYAKLYLFVGESFALVNLARLLLSAAVLLPPCFLMGGTLPVLLAHFADRLDRLGRRAGWVYGMNALGAALGSFLSGYLLLNLLGMAWTNALAATLNLAIGALAWVLSRRMRHLSTSEAAFEDPAASAPGIGASPKRNPSALARLAVFCFCLSGFACMSYEMIWLRYLTLYFQDTLYLYSGILAVFILGTGLGSLCMGPLASRGKAPVALFGLLQVGLGFSALLSVYAPVPFFPSVYRAGQAGAGHVLLLLSALLLIPTLLMGATFPVVARIVVTELREVGDRIGHAYALNTLGGIAGLLGSTFVLPSALGLQGTLYLLLGLNVLLGTLLMAADPNLPPRLRLFAAATPWCCALAAVVAIERTGLRLPEALLRSPLSPKERLLEVREGALGITWATGGQGTVYLWENGARIGRGGRGTSSVQGFIPMLIAPEIPRDVLGLAFGAGLSSLGPRLFPEVRRLDLVDLSPENVEVALRQVPENRGLREDPRARFVLDDAYGFLKHHADLYDLILMEPTPPRFGYRCADLYTREFYELVRERLAERGLFAQVLALGDLSPQETAGVMRTFSTAFAHCLLWKNGGDCLMLGGEHEFRIDVPAVIKRLARPEVQRTLRASAPPGERPWLLENLLSGLLLADRDFREASAGGEVYTEDWSGLRFSTGREVTTGNVRAIHAHLTPWAELVQRFDGFEEAERRLPLLAMRREFSMTLLYRDRPREFHAVFLAYLEHHSLTKDADRELLRAYLLDHGLRTEAEQLDARTREQGR